MSIRNIVRIYLASHFENEDRFQEGTAKVLDQLAEMGGLSWFHPSPNTYRRGLPAKLGARLGAKGKRMGVKAGVPDCIIYSHDVSIELKMPNGATSPAQKEWMKKAATWGWNCHVCKSAQEVIDVLSAMFPKLWGLKTGSREEIL